MQQDFITPIRYGATVGRLPCRKQHELVGHREPQKPFLDRVHLQDIVGVRNLFRNILRSR